MAMAGANPFAIQKAMGHKDIKTTMIYLSNRTRDFPRQHRSCCSPSMSAVSIPAATKRSGNTTVKYRRKACSISTLSSVFPL